MMEKEKHTKSRQDVTVVVGRELWRQLKYEAWRRQMTAKKMLSEALEQALEKWRKEKC